MVQKMCFKRKMVKKKKKKRNRFKCVKSLLWWCIKKKEKGGVWGEKHKIRFVGRKKNTRWKKGGVVGGKGKGKRGK